MTEEEFDDDDVVFENSPLFQYLHDLGHTDFEACPTGSQEEGCGGDGEEAPPLGDSQKRSGGHLWRLVDALWRCVPIGRAAACQSMERELDCVFGQYSVRCILDQDVLLQEDVELIELLDPALLTLGSPPPPPGDRSPAPPPPPPLLLPPRPGLLASPSLWDVAGLVGLAAVLLGICSASGSWSLASAAAAAPWGLVLLGGAGAARGARLWRRGGLRRRAHAAAAEVQALVQESKALTGVARKALRLVQETEVISRGFTLVSAAGSFSRAGLGAEPRGQQLIGLRKALYRALRTAFRASRRATCHMLKSFPLNSEIDNMTNYVSAVPLKELGLGLGVEHVGDEQAQELTDDYSLPALKLMFQLWVAQSSECFRRLALLLSARQREEQQEPVAAAASVGLESPSASATPPCAALHRSITAVTVPLHHALAGCLGEVQRSYDFHRYFETQPRSGPGSERTGQARQACRELNTLHTSIRSLQLHLKALLSEMIILEDDLEKLMVCGERASAASPPSPPLSGEGYLELSRRLHTLQPHMQASTSCWEDTVAQVDRMLRRTANTGSGVQQCPPATPHAVPTPTPTPSFPLILDRDPVPEELEWEAYVSDSDSDSEGRSGGGGGGSWYDPLTPEERERQRRGREESRRVLSELKAVLGVRASDGERLKWKQLLFSDRAAMRPVNREDPSGIPSSAGPPAPLEDSNPTTTTTTTTTSNHNHHDPGAGGGDGEEDETRDDGDDEEEKERERGRAAARTESDGEPVTEFSCGLDKMAAKQEEGEEEEEKKEQGAGGSELYQYDGLPGDASDDAAKLEDCWLKHRVTALSTGDRLLEFHGAEALGISGALARQVAARSQALVHMEEQTFGDHDDSDHDDDDDEDRDEGDDAVTREKT